MNTNKGLKKTFKIIFVSLLSLLGVILLAALLYVVYMLLDYSRIPDNMSLDASNNGSSDAILIGEEYTVLSQNIGFGAYTKDFTFFMDGGTQSWAKSADSVKSCVKAAADTADNYSPDFILFQEVDTDSTRSYHIDQKKILTDRFSSHSSVFAQNYHSSFLFYPFNQPHGVSNSGLLTLSRYDITASLRRSLPISTGFTKFLDLDRAYSVTRIPTENSKELIIYNVHMSAYGGSPEIREAQMSMLFTDMQSEYEKGNYCVCGGDFNHDFTGNSQELLNGGKSKSFDWAQPFPVELLPDGILRCTDYDEELVPSCRNCDIPYVEGNFTIIVDGFLVSDNVEAVGLRNIDTQFEYSDHNPVLLKFKLK